MLRDYLMTSENDTGKGNYEEQHKIKEDLKDCTVCGCPITRKDYDDYKMCPWCYSQASLKIEEGGML